MNISVSQIYIEPGISYHFSHRFQLWLGQKLTEMVKPSLSFSKKYTGGYGIVFRVSARVAIAEVETKGPTVFKRTREVEFSIFLPHAGLKVTDRNDHIRAFKFLMQGIVSVVKSLGLDEAILMENASKLADDFCSDPSMISPPRWDD